MNKSRVVATIFVWLSWAAVIIALNTHSSPNITSTGIETVSIVASAMVVSGNSCCVGRRHPPQRQATKVKTRVSTSTNPGPSASRSPDRRPSSGLPDPPPLRNESTR